MSFNSLPTWLSFPLCEDYWKVGLDLFLEACAFSHLSASLYFSLSGLLGLFSSIFFLFIYKDPWKGNEWTSKFSIGFVYPLFFSLFHFFLPNWRACLNSSFWRKNQYFFFLGSFWFFMREFFLGLWICDHHYQRKSITYLQISQVVLGVISWTNWITDFNPN